MNTRKRWYVMWWRLRKTRHSQTLGQIPFQPKNFTRLQSGGTNQLFWKVIWRFSIRFYLGLINSKRPRTVYRSPEPAAFLRKEKQIKGYFYLNYRYRGRTFFLTINQSTKLQRSCGKFSVITKLWKLNHLITIP